MKAFTKEWWDELQIYSIYLLFKHWKWLKWMLLAFFFFLTIKAFNQTEYGSYTLFQTKEKNIVNGYLSFDGSLTKINEYIVGAAGATIGVTTNHAFTIGITGSWIFDSPNDIKYNGIVQSGYEFYSFRKYCGYGGILLEPTLFPKFPFHITFPCVVGIGSITYALQNDGYWTNYDYILDKSWFWIFNAGARLEFNVVQGLRISCGPSYRYIPNLRMNNTDPNMMNGFGLDFSIKIGKY